MSEIAASTWRHLGLGLRAMFFRRIDRAQMHAIGPEPVLLALLSLLVAGLFDIWKVEQMRLSAWGVTSEIAATAVLAAVVLMMRPKLRGIDSASLIAVVMAMGAIFTAGYGIVEWVWGRFGAEDSEPGAIEMIAGLIAAGWFFGALYVLGRRSSDVRPRRFGAGLVAASLIGAFVLPVTPVVMDARESSPGLLQTALNVVRSKPKARPAGEPAFAMIDSESTFARQAQLIDRQLDALAPSRPGVGEVYFVGMATYSMQEVFKREITSARAIMDERFGTRGHSVVMVNHRETVDSEPLATIVNLERVLWRLAQRMDAEHDVLVLYVTTHGSEGMMAVSLPGMQLNELTPGRLSKVLERTGIRNKVVVLSACHAGSFVPGVANPQTLVMAAARADRSSFGCSNERDWTYFGDALFNHAFRQTHSMTEAFARARTLVGEWETTHKMAPPSEPQSGGGEALSEALARVEKRLTETSLTQN